MPTVLTPLVRGAARPVPWITALLVVAATVPVSAVGGPRSVSPAGSLAPVVAAAAGTRAAAATVATALGALPLSFAPDAAGTSYAAVTKGGTVELTADRVSIVPAATDGHGLEMGLVGGTLVAPQPLDRLPGTLNDIHGSDASLWRTGVATFARVRYPSVYPGIDLDYHGATGTLEYDFRVGAGADPSAIGVRFGDAPLRLTDDGSLVVGTGDRAITQAPPVAYQETGAGRVVVPAAFELVGTTVRFTLGAYDHARPLVIDPLVLSYSTFLGGTKDDEPMAVAVDSSGNAYIAGRTVTTESGTDFPRQGGYGGIGGTVSDNTEIFLTKLNASGTALIYSSVFGGDRYDSANGVAVGIDGSAYITGETTSTDFPHDQHSLYNSLTGSASDAFVTRMNPAGDGFVYSTYLGGTGTDVANAITVDASGAAYITGRTTSIPANTNHPEYRSYPITASEALQDTGDGSERDAFVTKVAPDGLTTPFSGYIGGTGGDEGEGIVVDSIGQPVIVGSTTSTVLGTSRNDYQTRQGPGGSYDAFLIRLTNGGGNINWVSYFGGSANQDYATAATLGPDDDVYVVGSTNSIGAAGVTIPFKNGYEAPPTASSGSGGVGEAFLARFDLDTSGPNALVYSSALGGGSQDAASSVAAGVGGTVFVGGNTSSTDFDKVGAFAGAGKSAFVAEFDTTKTGAASLLYSTQIVSGGAYGSDVLNGIAVDSSNAAYVVGATENASFPTTTGAFDTTANGAGYQNRDGFVTKIVDQVPGVTTTITSGPLEGGATNDSTPTFTFGTSQTGTSFECRVDTAPFVDCSGSPGASSTGSYTPAALQNGAHTFEVKGTVSGATGPVAARHFTVDVTAPTVSIQSGPEQSSTTNDATPTFTFAANETSTFTCFVDAQTVSPCTSPFTTSTLSNGAHTFAVRATDTAGNDSANATRTFTVAAVSPPPPGPPADTTPPDTAASAVVGKLKGRKKTATVTVTLTSEPEAGFLCSIDGSAFAPCAAVFAVKLKKGSHTVQARAVDAAGNVDPTPAVVAVRVKKKK